MILWPNKEPTLSDETYEGLQFNSVSQLGQKIYTEENYENEDHLPGSWGHQVGWRSVDL